LCGDAKREALATGTPILTGLFLSLPTLERAPAQHRTLIGAIQVAQQCREGLHAVSVGQRVVRGAVLGRLDRGHGVA
jgi:hypothetical protein